MSVCIALKLIIILKKKYFVCKWQTIYSVTFLNQFKPTKIKTFELTLSASSVICSEFQRYSPHIPPMVGFYFLFRPYQTVSLTIKKHKIRRQTFKWSTFLWFLVFIFFPLSLSIFSIYEKYFFICFYFLFCERERLCPED
jgi:hypothetical protein